MEKELIKTIELQLLSKLENYYCMTCDTVVEAKTFLMVEKGTQAIVHYMGSDDKNFICNACLARK